MARNEFLIKFYKSEMLKGGFFFALYRMEKFSALKHITCTQKAEQTTKSVSILYTYDLYAYDIPSFIHKIKTRKIISMWILCKLWACVCVLDACSCFYQHFHVLFLFPICLKCFLCGLRWFYSHAGYMSVWWNISMMIYNDSFLHTYTHTTHCVKSVHASRSQLAFECVFSI